MAKETLLTLSRLYILHRFNIQELGARADVPLDEVDKMLLDQPVLRATAQKVLKALSLLTGQYYTFSNVKVTLIEDNSIAPVYRHLQKAKTHPSPAKNSKIWFW